MALTQAFEDPEVRRLLAGDEREVAQAFDQLEKTLRGDFMRGVRRRLPGLGAEDVADAWQETLKDLLEALRGGRLDLLRDLRPWMWTVFQRNSFEQVGRVQRQRRAWERVNERLRGTSVGALVDALSPEERSRLLAGIRGVVEGMPPRQKLVIQTFLEEYPLTENHEALRRRVSERTGREETFSSVKRAFEEARFKITSLLKPRES